MFPSHLPISAVHVSFTEWVHSHGGGTPCLLPSSPGEGVRGLSLRRPHLAPACRLGEKQRRTDVLASTRGGGACLPARSPSALVSSSLEGNEGGWDLMCVVGYTGSATRTSSLEGDPDRGTSPPPRGAPGPWCLPVPQSSAKLFSVPGASTSRTSMCNEMFMYLNNYINRS